MQCPKRDEIERCLNGQLTDAHSTRLFAHFAACDVCRQQIEWIERQQPNREELSSALRKLSVASKSVAASRELIERCQELWREQPWTDSANYLANVQQIRDYRLREPIGSGGMGCVFRATHQHLHRDVALKVLAPARLGNEAATRRFRLEMQAVGQLEHPNIVRASDAGEDNGILYLVMDWVEGIDLQQVTDLAGPLSAANAAEVGRQVACGLAYAHAKGMVHRDIKPSNLLLTTKGDVRILDFGLALLPRELSPSGASVAGSLPFMAPEQFHDPASVTAAADVFGLGATLYRLLTGEALFGETGPAAMFCDPTDGLPQLAGRFDRPEIPAGWRDVLLRMLAAKPDERPTASQLVSDLHRFAAAADLTRVIDVLSADQTQRPAHWNSLTTFPRAHPGPSNWHRPATWAVAMTIGAMMVSVPVASLLSRKRELVRPGTPPPAAAADADAIDKSVENVVSSHTTGTRRAAEVIVEDLSEIGPFELTELAVWGAHDDQAIQIRIAPGRQIKVQFGSPGGENQSFEAWDLLDLKMKHERAFAVFQAFLPAIQQARRWEVPRPAKTSSTSTLLPPATAASARFRSRSGVELSVEWIDGICRHKLRKT